MKKKKFGKPLSRLITMVAICMLSLNAVAYDFSYTYQEKTLYYNITSDSTIEVTHNTLGNYVSGNVIIPISITQNNKNYRVTSIGHLAFGGCSSLCSVFISDNITSIGEHAFAYCNGLTSVTIPNSVTFIGDYAFYSCSKLSSIIIPNSVSSIGRAFYSCSGLTSITIPNSVTSIDTWAFWGCNNLTSVSIGNNVTSIGYGAFKHCNGLTSIVSKAVVPPSIDSEAFPNPNSCNVTVPCGSLEAYTSSEWNDYFPNRIEEDCSVSLQTVESTREFVLYPNPASGFVTIEFEALQERSLLRIIDLGGKVVKTFDIAAGTESIRLDLRDLPSGVYTLMIGNTTKKLIVE